MTLSERRGLIERLFRRLLRAFGPQSWWPADSPFEVVVGAILTQNTAWKNVSTAIARLKEAELLDPEAMHRVEEERLAEIIRPSGYFNQKARRLKAFCRNLSERWDGNLDRFLSRDMEELRADCLTLHGIGPETADSIVLYAAQKPSFVVDAYTRRIFSRHGWVPDDIRYDALRDYFMDCLERDVYFFQEYHALLVRLGHRHCRRKPSCSGCPLEGFPFGGLGPAP